MDTAERTYEDGTSVRQESVIRPPPQSTSSSLADAFAPPPPPKPLPTEPPPWYNPYPYPRDWSTVQMLSEKEMDEWNHMEDNWMLHNHRGLIHIRDIVYNKYTMSVAARQKAARWQWEEEMILTQSRPQVAPRSPEGEGEWPHQDVYFESFWRDKGIPMKAVIAGRRELQHCLRDANKFPFKRFQRDAIKVQMKWPAYPDYEPDRQILITTRSRASKRKPATNTQLIISLGSFFAQYYEEVSKMEPHPAFAHLALGPEKGKTPLSALRLMGIRAVPGECFELEVELDTVKPQPDSDDDDQVEEVNEIVSTVVPSSGIIASSTTATVCPAPTSGPSDKVSQPDEDRAKTPPWAGTLPVTCTVGPPPQIPHHTYFSHVDPLKLRSFPLPVWPGVNDRR